MLMSGENSELQLIFSSTGIDDMLLLNYSPELNLIALVFNAMHQNVESRYHESMLSTGCNILDFFYKVINPITLYIIIYCI